MHWEWHFFYSHFARAVLWTKRVDLLLQQISWRYRSTNIKCYLRKRVSTKLKVLKWFSEDNVNRKSNFNLDTCIIYLFSSVLELFIHIKSQSFQYPFIINRFFFFIVIFFNRTQNVPIVACTKHMKYFPHLYRNPINVRYGLACVRSSDGDWTWPRCECLRLNNRKIDRPMGWLGSDLLYSTI